MASRQQECFICLGSFKNPKLISCHHSFCYKCLEDYVRINVRNHRFDCPMCKTNVELPKGGVKDFQTDVYLDTNSGKNFACDLCGPNSDACSRCLDCEENLCQSCSYVHEKLKVSKHHKISDLGTLDSVMKGNIRQRILCDQHQEEEIKLFCRDCNVLICVVCKAVNHQIHATKTVVDAAAEVKQILQTKMSVCSDKMKRILSSKEKGEELDRCIDDAEREDFKAVEDQRSQLNQVLEEEVAKVKVKTKTVYLKRRLQNSAFKRDMQNEIKTCSNAYENAKMLTGQGTDIEIIKKGPDLLQLISEAMSTTERSPDTNLKNKLFSPAIIKKTELISMIGIIQDSSDSPTETEASSPVVEKENEDPTEGIKIQDKVIAMETNPPPPIVTEEVVDTVDINVANVDSSDVSIAVENKKKEKLKLKYNYKEDQFPVINDEDKKQYDVDVLPQLQNAPESTLKPLGLPDIPDIIIKKPTETEASSAVVEKENEDPTEGIKIQDKIIATETNPPPPIVTEEVVDTVDINVENVDSSDVSIAVENEKNEQLKLECKEDQFPVINDEDKKQYDVDVLPQLQNAPESTLKPLGLPDIPDIIIKKPTETEASSPLVEKGNKDPSEGTINQDKVITTETNPPPPIVTEDVLDAVEINIENVDSSDVSIAVENEKNEKLKLKYKYKEDQWSPINHEGKRQYDRDFLLQLQNAPESTLKPHDLPDIPDMIIEKPTLRPAKRDFAEGSSFVDLTPRYVWSGGPNRSGGVPRRSSGQRGRFGPGGSATQTKHINLSIEKDIELHHEIGTCKPGHRTEKIDQDEVDLKSEELVKKVESILNKHTPHKFQTLVAKMQTLEIDTEARLKSVIDLVFEKVISEPGLSVAYANMCLCLSMFKVPAESKQRDVTFRALLLTRCQREFEKTISSEKEFDSKRKEIEKATTEEQKQQMKEELENEEMKAKKRSLGNIRFIGELFKLKMLSQNVMHDCVYKLLRTKDEEHSEYLCILLKTIGKKLDTDKAKGRMDQYFAQMQKIVNEKTLSSRVRLMLQNMIELRQGKWVLRRDENNPKTIDQIHREVAQEAQDRDMFVKTLPKPKPQKGSHGRPEQPSGPVGGGADGWNMVFRATLRTDRSIDPTKLNLSKLGDSENIQLSPDGGTAQLGWFKGSTRGGAKSHEEEQPNAPGNRTIFAQRPSEENSSGREPERAKTVEKPSIPVQEFTDDQMLCKTRAIMDEYLHIQDVAEAISCVQELSSSGSLHLFVYNALNQVLERSEVARRQTGLLLHDLVKNNVLLVDTYVKGLNEILMFAEDMEIDIPKIWEYLGQLIGPMVQDGSVPFGFLKEVCEPLKANGKSGVLVAEILHDASHREGYKKVGSLWTESGLHWLDFVPKNQIDQFLSEKKLEFTKVGNSAPTSPTASMAVPKIEESLNDLITNKGCSNEEVFGWIEGEVDELTIKQEYFIRALMTAVCKSAVTVSSNNLMKVDKSQIQRRNKLLRKYLDHQANFELQALFALQALVHKLEHPPGVFRELFDILYDEDIISEDAFIQWEKSEDPREQEGKGVAMKHVVQFFTWLKEAEDDAES